MRVGVGIGWLLLCLASACTHAGEFSIGRESGNLMEQDSWSDAFYREAEDGTLEVLCLRGGRGLDWLGVPPAGPPEQDLLVLIIPSEGEADELQAEWFPGSQGSFIGYEADSGEISLKSRPADEDEVEGSFKLELVLRYPTTGSHPFVPSRLVLSGSFLADEDSDEVQEQMTKRAGLRAFLGIEEEESELDDAEGEDEK